MDYLRSSPLDVLRGKQPQLGAKQTNELLARIDRVPGLEGVRVGYYDSFAFRELRPHPPICQPNYLTVVIRLVDQSTQEVMANPSPEVRRRDSRFFTEIASGVVGCGAAAISWIVVGGSGAAIPFTAGASSAITVLTLSAAVASTAQCGNSGYRIYNEITSSRSKNEWLDSQQWYQQTLTALDVISLVGGVVSANMTLRMLTTLKSGRVGAKEALKGLSRPRRRQLTREIIVAQNPGLTDDGINALIAAGAYPKRFGKIALSDSIRLQLVDAVGAGLAFTGSAMGGVIRDPKRIPSFAVALYEEFETY